MVRKRGSNKGLFAIAWINVSRVEFLIVEKSFSGKFITDIFGGQGTEEAIKLICWDPEVQRDQTPMFALGNDRSRYPTLEDYILNRRDEAMRGLNQATRPKR